MERQQGGGKCSPPKFAIANGLYVGNFVSQIRNAHLNSIGFPSASADSVEPVLPENLIVEVSADELSSSSLPADVSESRSSPTSGDALSRAQMRDPSVAAMDNHSNSVHHDSDSFRSVHNSRNVWTCIVIWTSAVAVR